MSECEPIWGRGSITRARLLKEQDVVWFQIHLDCATPKVSFWQWLSVDWPLCLCPSFFLLLIFFWDTVLRSWVFLEFVLLLPHSYSCWDYWCAPPHLALSFNFFEPPPPTSRPLLLCLSIYCLLRPFWISFFQALKLKYSLLSILVSWRSSKLKFFKNTFLSILWNHAKYFGYFHPAPLPVIPPTSTLSIPLPL